MAAVQIYCHPISQPSRSVHMFVVAADIDHEYKMIDIMKGEQKREEYSQINPHQKVPALVDGDFKMSEGGAILVYLATTRGKESWYPSDPKKQARVNEWMHWAHTTIRKASTMGLLVPVLLVGKKIEELGDAQQAAALSLQTLDSNLGKSKFLAGDTPTVADLFVVPEVDQLQAFGLADLSEFKNVTRWLSDLQESVKGYKENYQQVEKAAQASNKK
mmetsp:Transcript_38837/g.54159  ORF Transcript_38837/g.54159 Transcript_38837/m.54159 type:complete len:217 (-) Transcript_38837:42-692(-)|eukprot:CAMPEP_0201487836 /NCGR_PEP_ID=MMETSP0151_2-20130828/15575_1 /ASSEMBLY_ACC=CAM_ASM_000257 /TAXON_ID=200890 /ORGANISM="Paramoeba atlantica, Strain 621/1 / CCAP 1560/9" /LENGTH=216 /DNA_ID=CAMNT_0047872989 /DNA_START=76 /DNA_END=726 /DNA_ORIENTATION=+